MPILHFKGKSVIQNHHHTVKFHELNAVPKKGLSKQPSLDDNLIIHGDNLAALKALLPVYAGKVKCIYIDPPYNTGNEGWMYNDNVNSPMIKKWFGEEVGRDDLARHDKWCCMMYPRLSLLRELMRDDGVIFISIDDNEVHNLRLVMDEIFGEQNFVACITARLNPRGRTLDKYLAKTHEYLLVYVKDSNQGAAIKQIAKTGDLAATYNKEDERGKLRELELRNRNPVFDRSNRPNLFFPIYVNPENGKVSIKPDDQFSVEVFPRNSKGLDGCWTWSKAKVNKEGEILVGREVSTGGWRIFRKDYWRDDSGNTAVTKEKALWLDKSINNENGKEICNEIFGTCPFDFPKSVELVRKCVELGSGLNDIVLDSFAGSGTTGHAVLVQNTIDRGERKFILVEMEKYADKVTAERVRRVIKGVPKAKDEALRKGLGGSFSYYELGDPVDIDAMLEGKKLPSYDNLAQYTFFTATGEALEPNKISQKDYYLGASSTYEVLMMYEPDAKKLRGMALNLEFAEVIEKRFPGKAKLVFAPACYLEEFDLRERNIRFAQLPFEIYRLAE